MDFYARIKLQVENRSCPVHHRFPVAHILNDNVVLTCCCTDFEMDCYNEILDILQGRAVNDPEAIGHPDENEQALENAEPVE